MTPLGEQRDAPDRRPAGASAFRQLLLIAAVLAVPIVPFLFFGETLEDRITDWLNSRLSPGTVAVAVIGLLASDILLPVPSSVVSTFAGRVLGFWGGAGASWCGMTIGAAIAFWLVRAFGRPLARWLSSDEALARTDALAARWGVLVLVVARPVPVLAEASVLLMGTTRLSWWRFLTAVNVRERFEQLKNDWKEQSRYLSNSAQKAMLWPYQDKASVLLYRRLDLFRERIEPFDDHHDRQQQGQAVDQHRTRFHGRVFFTN
jgi:uncharacterized membrane protein YdjX (TVP38/TMEM64 family)